MICPWLEGTDHKANCCEFWREQKQCLNADCIEFNGAEVRWHAAPYCPFCRGEGELVK